MDLKNSRGSYSKSPMGLHSGVWVWLDRGFGPYIRLNAAHYARRMVQIHCY